MKITKKINSAIASTTRPASLKGLMSESPSCGRRASRTGTGSFIAFSRRGVGRLRGRRRALGRPHDDDTVAVDLEDAHALAAVDHLTAAHDVDATSIQARDAGGPQRRLRDAFVSGQRDVALVGRRGRIE